MLTNGPFTYPLYSTSQHSTQHIDTLRIQIRILRQILSTPLPPPQIPVSLPSHMIDGETVTNYEAFFYSVTNSLYNHRQVPFAYSTTKERFSPKWFPWPFLFNRLIIFSLEERLTDSCDVPGQITNLIPFHGLGRLNDQSGILEQAPPPPILLHSPFPDIFSFHHLFIMPRKRKLTNRLGIASKKKTQKIKPRVFFHTSH